MDRRRIQLLDTTLRDGEQSPGCCFTLSEKIAIVRYLDEIGVDTIEAGFPASSDGQFRDFVAVCREIKNASVAAMSRLVEKEIVRTSLALSSSRRPLLHLSAPVSPLLRKVKFNASPSQLIDMAVEAVRFAKGYAAFVEIGAEDATRADISYVNEFVAAVLDAGADRVNISDTVGAAVPEEITALISTIYKTHSLLSSGERILSIHCHNDLGLATANTLAGLLAGALQCEVTLSGIGERAGNASLEEVVSAVNSRSDYYSSLTHSIDTSRFAEGASLIGASLGVVVAPNKPVIGSNCFLHSSGIHQSALLKDELSYRTINPADVGAAKDRMALSKYSGRKGFAASVQEICMVNPGEDVIEQLFVRFKEFADGKKTIGASDLIEFINQSGIYHVPMLTVRETNLKKMKNGRYLSEMLLHGEHMPSVKGIGTGDNEFEAAVRAFSTILKLDPESFDYSISVVKKAERSLSRIALSFSSEDIFFQEEILSDDIRSGFIRAMEGIANRISIRRNNGYKN